MDLIATDVLCRPGERPLLQARLEHRDLFRRGAARRLVRVRRAGSSDGLQRRTDHDGNVVFVIEPLEPGDHRFELEAADAAQPPTAVILVCCRRDDRPTIVYDIDGTLTRDATTLFTPPHRSLPRDRHAVEVVVELGKHFDAVYLTGRRRHHANTTRQWLDKHGLPPGPLFQQNRRFPIPGFLSGVWKEAFLRELRTRFPGIVAGVGNTRADAAAYAGNGMLPLIFRAGPVVGFRLDGWDQAREILLSDATPPAIEVPLQRGSRRLVFGPAGGVRCDSGSGGPAWEISGGPWSRVREELWMKLRSDAPHHRANSVDES